MSRILFMTSHNFEFLRSHWVDLANLGGHAEQYVFSDPQSALVKLRCFAEHLVGLVYRFEGLHTDRSQNFHDRLNNTVFTCVVDRAVLEKLHAIRTHGNHAAHEGKANSKTALWLLKEAHILAWWLLLNTGKANNAQIEQFVEPKSSKRSEESSAKHKQRLLKAIDELEAAKKAEQDALQENARLQQALESRRLDLAEDKKRKIRSVLDFNEAETRRRLIDTELYSRGWDIDLKTGKNTEQVEFEVEVSGQPTPSGFGKVDYVLNGDNGIPIAVIEAKRCRENVNKGRKQAELYADALEQKHGLRPVIFYTNGYDIYLLDDAQGYPPRKIYSYYSKESVEYLIRQRDNKRDLTQAKIDTDIAGRMYQIESITRISERFQQKHRKALVVQATGTGKTRVSIALIKRMIDASWAKRILFLCDRKELRKQAGDACSEYLSEAVYVVGTSKKSDEKNARIYVATYPGMMNIMSQFDPGFFDLIIADESHRSIYNVYGDLFKYFDALQLGLTATPVEMISRSTSRLFGCDYKQPTASYPLDEAIKDKMLSPFKVVSFTTQFLREGIKGHSLSDEQVAELEDQGFDPNELDFDAKQIDKTCFNKDTNRVLLRNLMEKGLRHADGQTLGKSIIFARNIKHAEILAELFTDMYPELGSNFCRVIHSNYERAGDLIDDFKLTDNPSKQVTLAISVDMLDTGIDVPSVLNLVFAKPVKSKVKFWQMVGRGTRLCSDLFGLGKDKEKFLIFDHWNNFEYFKMNPEEEEVRQPKSLSQKSFESRIIFSEEALKKGEVDQFEQMIKLIHQDITTLNRQSISVKDHWKAVEYCQNIEVLKKFSPRTKQTLLEDIAPLMQWQDIRGKTEAIKFDMDICNAQYGQLAKPDILPKARLQLETKVRNLAMELTEVRNQSAIIKQLQQDEFWQQISFEQLELVRQNLRPVIHLQSKGSVIPPEPTPILDIREEAAGYQVSDVRTHIATNDYEIYRKEVEKELTPLFEKDPVLQKIRCGDAVSKAELDQLNSLIHTQNPNVDLNLLAEFYPESSASIDQLLRTMIGLDQTAIDSKMTAFIQNHHLSLNALQQRFLALLRKELCRKGQLQVADLYEHPFDQIGLEGIFRDDEVDLIVEYVNGFAVESGKVKQKIEIEAEVTT